MFLSSSFSVLVGLQISCTKLQILPNLFLFAPLDIVRAHFKRERNVHVTYGNVFAALLEALRQLRDDVLVVVEKHPQQVAILLHVVVVLNLGEVVEDVEGTDVELVDGEDRGVAADDERKISESGDAVGYADRKLLAKVFGTPLR